MKIIYLALTLVALASCSGNNAEEVAGAETAKFNAYKFDNSEWVETDLSTISPIVHVTVKVPKDAVLTKNEFDGVDIKMGDYYHIKVGIRIDENLAAIKKFYTMDRTDGSEAYKDIKVAIDEPNGIVYTYTSILEGSQPESHFFYAMETPEPDKFIVFQDEVPFMETIPGSGYPLENAKKAYEMIKSSARNNPAAATE